MISFRFFQESDDFSNFQMKRLLKRRSIQVSLEEVEKEIGGRTLSLGDVEAMLAEEGVEITEQVGSRIASDDVTRYVYVSGMVIEIVVSIFFVIEK